MKGLLSARVSLGWFLGVAALVAAVLLVGKVAFLDAPPSGVVISVSTPQATPGAEALRGAKVQTAVPSQDPQQLPLTPAAAPADTHVTAEDTRPRTAATPTEAVVVVYISGAVAKPGVYRLPEGSRLAEAIDMAGGLAQDANPDLVNLAERLHDEEHVVIQRQGDTPAAAQPSPTPMPATTAQALKTPRSNQSPTSASGSALPTGAKININKATEVELEELPGIGPSLAERIIAYRQEHGPFATIEGIMEVSGIKDAIFSRIRDYITVAP